MLFATFVDHWMCERRINHLAGVCPRIVVDSFFFPSVSPVSSSKQIELPAVPCHFHPVIRTSLSGFNALTWPKELPVFAPVVYCCCRGDPRRSHRGNVIIAQSASQALILSQARRHMQSVPKRVSRTMHATPLTNDD